MSDPSQAGEGGSGPPSPPPAPGVPAPTTPATPGQTFTQEDVDRLIGQRTAEAQRQASRNLVKELGFEKVDDLKALVTAQRDAEKAQMTEAERLRTEAAEAKAATDTERQLLANERHSLSVERELTKAGAQGDTARLVRMVESEVGAEPKAVSEAVGKLKADFPALFGTSALPSSEPAGGGIPPRPTSTHDPLEAGRLKAEAYAKGQRSGF